MNIHEYQAKQVLAKFGVPVLKGGVAYTPEEAEQVARGLDGPVFVVKSQIHAGGRGKGRFKESEAGDKGGVRVVKSIDDVRENASQMLGNTLVTRTSRDPRASRSSASTSKPAATSNASCTCPCWSTAPPAG